MSRSSGGRGWGRPGPAASPACRAALMARSGPFSGTIRPDPQAGPPPGPGLPSGQVDTIADDPDLRYQVPPGARGVPAHRGEDHRARARLDRGLQPGRRRRVQRADHPDRQQARHRDGQVVQAVVVDHVEGGPALFGEVEHQLQVGVVLLEPPRRLACSRRRVPPALIRGLDGSQLAHAEFRITARAGEHSHLVSAALQAPWPGPRYAPPGRRRTAP